MKLTLTSNAAQFQKRLIEYCKTSSKGFSAALAKQGSNFAQELYQQFRQIKPKTNSIFEAAKMRGYRVARRSSTFLVPTSGNLSQRAIERATELLGGQKSGYFKVMSSGALSPMRFGVRGSHRVLLGGKTGWRVMQPGRSALQAYQLTPSQLKASLASFQAGGSDFRRLNLRALATYLELRYRQRAGLGGTMAVQWLNNTYKFAGKGSFKTSQLVKRSATGRVIGTVDFIMTGADLTEIVFNGYVPGTPEEAEKHGVLDKVFAARSADLLVAIAQAHVKAAKENHLN